MITRYNPDDPPLLVLLVQTIWYGFWYTLLAVVLLGLAGLVGLAVLIWAWRTVLG